MRRGFGEVLGDRTTKPRSVYPYNKRGQRWVSKDRDRCEAAIRRSTLKETPETNDGEGGLDSVNRKLFKQGWDMKGRNTKDRKNVHDVFIKDARGANANEMNVRTREKRVGSRERR